MDQKNHLSFFDDIKLQLELELTNWQTNKLL